MKRTPEEQATWKAKTLSRTWKITLYWLVAMPVAFIAQIILTAIGSPIELPVGIIVGGTMAVSTAYTAKRAIQAKSEGSSK